MLEAAATGCKLIIATDNVEDNTYIPMDMVVMSKRTIDDSVNAILQNLQDDDPNLSLRQFIVDRFSWRIIGEKVKSFLLK